MDGQAAPTRVLVRGLPQLLQDLVQRLLGDNSEIELVEADPGPETALVLRQEHVDVLITGPDLAEQLGGHSELLGDRPQLAVLVLAEDGRELHWLRPVPSPSWEASPERLLQAIQALP